MPKCISEMYSLVFLDCEWMSAPWLAEYISEPDLLAY